MAGGKPCKTYPISKDGVTIAVNKEELQQYLNAGWAEGTKKIAPVKYKKG